MNTCQGDITSVQSFAGFPSSSKTSNQTRGDYHGRRRLLVPLTNNYLSVVERSFFSNKCSDFASIDSSKRRSHNRQNYESASDLDTRNVEGKRTSKNSRASLLSRSSDGFYGRQLDTILEKQFSKHHLRLPKIDLSDAKTKKGLQNDSIESYRASHQGRLQKMRRSIGEISPPMDSRLRKIKKSLELMEGKAPHYAAKHVTVELGKERDNNLHHSKEAIVESTSMHSFTSSRSRFSDSDSSKKSIKEKNPKVNYGAKFRRLSKFLVVLFGLWKEHAKKVKEFMETNVDLLEVDEPIDLLFDVTKFRADKQALLSEEVKEILLKRPEERDENEMKKVRVALGNYNAIAEYPLHMKRLMAQRAWCETVDPKRVIVQQGHPSRYFYFILSGSVIVTKQEEGTAVSKTDCFLRRGDSFGELGLITNAPRRATVISKERVELLVFNDEDYVDIFMSGGLHDKEDPFIKALPYFKDWPIEMVADNPSEAFLSYFKRGTAVIMNSKFLDWLIIVKSGSCKVLKRLHKVRPASELSQQEKDTRSELLDGHEAVIDQHLLVAQLRAEQRSMVYRKRMLQDLDLKIELYPITNKTRDESFVQEQLSSTNEEKRFSENAPDSEEPSSTQDSTKETKDGDCKENSPDKSGEDLVRTETVLTHSSSSEDNKEVPFITKAIPLKNPQKESGKSVKQKGLPKEKSGLSKDSTRVSWADLKRSNKGKKFKKLSTKMKHVAKAVEKKKWKPMNKEKKHTIIDDLNERYLKMNRPASAKYGAPVFVRLQTLTPGSMFGLHDILHDDQPSLSLVSNGSECVIISKKLFLEHASREFLRVLKNQISPYPPDSYFQESLQVYVDWKNTRQSTYGDILFQTKFNKTDPNDSRSLSKTAKLIGEVH